MAPTPQIGIKLIRNRSSLLAGQLNERLWKVWQQSHSPDLQSLQLCASWCHFGDRMSKYITEYQPNVKFNSVFKRSTPGVPTDLWGSPVRSSEHRCECIIQMWSVPQKTVKGGLWYIRPRWFNNMNWSAAYCNWKIFSSTGSDQHAPGKSGALVLISNSTSKPLTFMSRDQ